MKQSGTFITYLRVSTQAQGDSGLGLEAQRAAVSKYLRDRGAILKEYVEVESGGKNNRVQLAAAIEEAKRTSSTLIIAKLDRLSRNAAFILALRDSGVQFQAADLPSANALTVGIFALIAEHERDLIARRTKDALNAKRLRGEALGTVRNLTDEGRKKGMAQRIANAKDNTANKQAKEIIDLHLAKGLSLTTIAARLNSAGFRTRRGCQFTPSGVARLRSLKLEKVA